MSTPAKILVILIFLLGVGVVFLSLKSSATIGKQEELIESLQASSLDQGKVIETLSAQTGPAKEKIVNLNEQNEQLSTEIAEVKAAKEAVDAELAETKDAKEKVEGELAEAVAKIDPLEKQISSLESDVAKANQGKADAEAKIAGEKKRAEVALHKLNEMKSVVAAYPKQWKQMLDPNIPNVSAATDEGTILVVKPHGIAALAFDGSMAIEKGDTCTVMKGEEKAGKVAIGDVYRTIVIYQQKPGKKQYDVQVGDVLKVK